MWLCRLLLAWCSLDCQSHQFDPPFAESRIRLGRRIRLLVAPQHEQKHTHHIEYFCSPGGPTGYKVFTSSAIESSLSPDLLCSDCAVVASLTCFNTARPDDPRSIDFISPLSNLRDGRVRKWCVLY
ncbi:hypothetical protein DMENIID0001_106540 [Sergentomyia squamirostris]